MGALHRQCNPGRKKKAGNKEQLCGTNLGLVESLGSKKNADSKQWSNGE